MKTLLVVMCTTLGLVGCTWTVDMRPGQTGTDTPASDPFFVEARLVYPARIALPGDAELLVAVEAVDKNDRHPLTRFSSRLDGRQAPLPLGFSVEPEDDADTLYELSAAILSGERLLGLTGPVLVLPRNGRARLGEVLLRAPLDTGFGEAWQCGQTSVMFGAIDDRVFLGVDDRLHPAKSDPATSGDRYRSVSEPTLAVHEKSGQFVLIRGEQTESDCKRVEALAPPLSGGDNEPGWHIEVRGGRIKLISDYGQTVTEAALIQTGSSGRTTRFRGLGEHGPVLAAFAQTVCRDSATGMPHPYAVDVQFEGGKLVGCGGRPRDLLNGKTWRVVDLGTGQLFEFTEGADDIEITVHFDSDGRLGGHAACNRFMGSYELGGEGLTMTPTAETKRTCSERLMSLESRFLNRLSNIERFDLGEAGELILMGSEGRITALELER